jgi:hypothetical protein
MQKQYFWWKTFVGKKHPTIHLLLSLAKPNQADQSLVPGQVNLHRSLQWSLLSLFKGFIT